jgi:transmembrane sensor
MSDSSRPANLSALEWLTRRHSGRWSAADERDLAAWLSADPSHPDAWRHAKTLWHDLDGLRPFAAAELRAAYSTHSAGHPLGSRLWQMGLALTGIGAVALGLLMIWLPGSLDAIQTYRTARGEQRTVILADGSGIELNTATQVRIDYGLSCRCVRLTGGEAVFRVAHGDPRRFEVLAGRGSIRDIGTEFWVRDESTQTAVAVLEGAVEIAGQPDAQPVRLLAGERRAWDDAGRLLEVSPAAPPVADLAAWRAGAIVFRDAPLTEVLAEFARYHAVAFDLDAQLHDYRLSGRFPSTDLDGLLKLIQSAYPVEVRRSAADRVSIRVKGTGNS